SAPLSARVWSTATLSCPRRARASAASPGPRCHPWTRWPPVCLPASACTKASAKALHRSLAHGIRPPARSALAAAGPVPVCWYGQHDAAWVAYYDALHRLGLARYGLDDTPHLGHWAALARSCGWWWPGERVCVI